MSRASGSLWLVIALILAILAGGVVFVTLQRASAQGPEVGVTDLAPVVVAARPLLAGALLTEADVMLQQLPSATLPAGTLSSPSDVVNQVTMAPLQVGETILRHHLTAADITAGNLGFALPEGLVAVTLAADDLVSRAQMVQTGSRVDILYSLRIKVEGYDPTGNAEGAGQTKEAQFTFGALQGATIVGVLRGAASEQGGGGGGLLGGAPAETIATLGAPYAYILALEPQDALTLKFLRDADAIMDLAVRNVSDEAEHEIQPVDLKYLIDKYQIPVR